MSELANSQGAEQGVVSKLLNTPLTEPLALTTELCIDDYLASHSPWLDEHWLYANAATCPECDSGMTRQGRCCTCPSCGFSNCG